LPPLNKNLNELVCHMNLLTKLPPLNKNLQLLWCPHNKLTKLSPLNKNLRELYCEDNQLTDLPFLNKNLEKIRIFKNPINDVLDFIDEYDNYDENDDVLHDPNIKIIRRRKINTINTKIKILNNFRYLFYSLKFKKQFRYWLWKIVREPKIIRGNHPDNLSNYLNENLNEEHDLEEVLENWISNK